MTRASPSETGYPPKAATVTITGGGLDEHDLELAHPEAQFTALRCRDRA